MTDIQSLERQLKALGSGRRLMMLKHLKRYHTATVSELARAAGIKVFAASQHLRVLRAAGIVTFSKRGLYVTYRISLVQEAPAKTVLRML